MAYVANKDFFGVINGSEIELKKGAEFKGDKRTEDVLKSLDLLAVKKPVKKGEVNEH